MGAKLRARDGFHAFGKDYGGGQEIPIAHTRTWPAGTLDTRLANGSVYWEADEDDDEGAPDKASARSKGDDVTLVARRPFHAFGVDYVGGMHITEEDLASWPDGTLSTRLQNGDVEYVTIEEGEMAEDRIITRDAQGNPDGGAPKTAVGDPIKDAQPARAKESALQPDAGSTDAEPTDEEERGAAETGTLEEQEFEGEEDDGPVSTADDIDNMTRKQIAAYIEENYPDHADEIDPTEPKPTVVAKAKKIIEDSAK